MTLATYLHPEGDCRRQVSFLRGPRAPWCEQNTVRAQGIDATLAWDLLSRVLVARVILQLRHRERILASKEEPLQRLAE